LVHLIPLIQQHYYPPRAHYQSKLVEAFVYDVENRIRSGEPLSDLLDHYPEEIADIYATNILRNHRTLHFGLLSKGSGQTKALKADLDTYSEQVSRRKQVGGLSKLLEEFYKTSGSQWKRPLWEGKKLNSARSRLVEAKAIAREYGLVNFPANKDTFPLIEITQALFRLTAAGLATDTEKPNDALLGKMMNAQMFYGVVCPIELLKAMTRRYHSDRGVPMRNFLPFMPILMPALSVSSWAEYSYGVNTIAKLLGYWGGPTNCWASQYRALIGKQIVPGMTLEQEAFVYTDGSTETLSVEDLNPKNTRSRTRIGPQNQFGHYQGYFTREKNVTDRFRDKVFSGNARRKLHSLDYGASAGINSNLIVQVFHPDFWNSQADCYRPSTVFRSKGARWGVWNNYVGENPETKPTITLGSTKDKRWPTAFRMYRKRGYRFQALRRRPVGRDPKFAKKMMNPALVAELCDLFPDIKRSERDQYRAVVQFVGRRYGTVHCRYEVTGVHNKRRLVQAPSKGQKFVERHLNRLAQAAFAFLNRELFGENIDLYLVGCAPWMNSGPKLRKLVGRFPNLPVLNFDIVSCFQSISLFNPLVLAQTRQSIQRIHELGYPDEASLFDKIYLDYYWPLLQALDVGEGISRKGEIEQKDTRGVPAGFPLTPIFLYILLFDVFMHLRECQAKGMILGWVQAGDDSMVIGAPNLSPEQMDQVWAPIESFAEAMGIEFSHWKNYTKDGGLVPNYSKCQAVDFSNPWIVEFPLRHYPLYHAGVGVFKGNVFPNCRFIDDELEKSDAEEQRRQALSQIKSALIVSRQINRPNLFVPTCLVKRLVVDPTRKATQMVSDYMESLFLQEGHGRNTLSRIWGSVQPTSGESLGDLSNQESSPKNPCNPVMGDRCYALEFHALSRSPLTHIGGWYAAQRNGSRADQKWFFCAGPRVDQNRKAKLLKALFQEMDRIEENRNRISDDEAFEFQRAFNEAMFKGKLDDASKILGEIMFRDKGILCYQTISESDFDLPEGWEITAQPILSDKTELSYLLVEKLRSLSDQGEVLFKEARCVLEAMDWLADPGYESALLTHNRSPLAIAPKLYFMERCGEDVRSQVESLAESLTAGVPIFPNCSVFYDREEEVYKCSGGRLCSYSDIDREPDGGQFWRILNALNDPPRKYKYLPRTTLSRELLRVVNDRTLALIQEAADKQFRNLNQKNFANIMANMCPEMTYERYWGLMLKYRWRVELLRRRVRYEFQYRSQPTEMAKGLFLARWENVIDSDEYGISLEDLAEDPKTRRDFEQRSGEFRIVTEEEILKRKKQTSREQQARGGNKRL
jgi:hypothetical protein